MRMRPDTHAIFLSGYCNQRLGFGLAAPDALLRYNQKLWMRA